MNSSVFVLLKSFSCATIRPLLTKDSIEVRIGEKRLCCLFSRIYRIGAKYRAKRVGDRIDPCSTSILILK